MQQKRLRLKCSAAAGRVRVVAAILIKKYGNRRLYDTSDSKYVTLEELAAKIRAGADLRVIDAQTNDDLTQATLAQIVLEGGNAAKFLPVQLLTQMIRLSDDALAEFFSRYVTNALDLYLQAKRGVQSISSYNPLAQIPVAAGDALARMWMGSPFAPPQYQQPYSYVQGAPPYVAPPPPPEDLEEDEPRQRKSTPAMERDRKSSPAMERERKSSPATGDRDDVAAMRRELDELKQALREGLAPKPVPRKKRGR
jgi:polyhydroxyalkanoate synthesis repressor PhaR